MIVNKRYIRQRHRRRAADKQPAAKSGAATTSRHAGTALRARIRNRHVLNRYRAVGDNKGRRQEAGAIGWCKSSPGKA
jgi:hypothetical protein